MSRSARQRLPRRVPPAVFRAMKVDTGGLPVVERSARGLGPRVPKDVEPDGDGIVNPGKGGISAVPHDPRNLETHRRPAEFGGDGRDPVWTIDPSALPAGLTYRATSTTHGQIEPSRDMSLAEYEELLAQTREGWTLYDG